MVTNRRPMAKVKVKYSETGLIFASTVIRPVGRSTCTVPSLDFILIDSISSSRTSNVHTCRVLIK